ncbi:MAG: hypothetical protein ACYTFO_05125 [Planctomycetota bacterium]|jgi:hypothetical protein
MPITTHTDLWGQLTVHLASGAITIDEVSDAIHAFYQGTPTKNVLWDAREASLANLTVHQIRHTVFEVGIFKTIGLVDVRIGGRTALVASAPEDFALGRVAVTLGELEELPFEGGVFRDLDEAKEWLSQSTDVTPSERQAAPPADRE